MNVGKQLAWALTVFVMTVASSQADPNLADPNLVEQSGVSGADLQSILVALPEFSKTNFDITKYRISVGQNGDITEVNFSDLSWSPSDGYGSKPGVPQFKVQLTPDKRHVANIIYIR